MGSVVSVPDHCLSFYFVLDIILIVGACYTFLCIEGLFGCLDLYVNLDNHYEYRAPLAG